MDDVNNAAGSSPAATAVEIEVPQNPNSPEYAEWRQTGKLPDTPKAPAASAAATPPVKAKSDAATAENEPDPESGQHQEPEKRTPGGKVPYSRFAAIVAEKNQLAERLAALENGGTAPKTADTKPADTKPTDAKAPEAPKKPVLKDYQTYEEYEAAKDEWLEQMADFRADQKLQAHIREQQEAQERAEAEKTKREFQESWSKRVADAAKRHPDFKDVVAVAAGLIPQGSLLDQWILHSESGAELVYHLGKNPPEVDRLSAIRNPVLLARELARMEAKFESGVETPAAEPAAQPQPRAADGTFAPKTPTPEKRVTDAPPPPTEVGGHGTAPPDEVDSAVQNNDFRRYMEAANRRDLASRKG